MTDKVAQPKKWIIFLLLAQSIYLLMEFAFNARIVDSITISNLSYFEDLSFLGRCISGIGFTLMCFTLIRYNPAFSVGKTIGIFVLTAGLAFPAVFFGQEKLINHFVDQSTADQRLQAQYLMLLKKGLANNAVVLKGIEYKKEDLDSPSIKTFISSLGFMVFFTPSYIQAVIQNSDQILDHIALQKANKELPTTYPSYLDARADVEGLAKKYNEANQLYVKKLNDVPEEAENIWKDIFVELEKQWSEIKSQHSSDQIEDSVDVLTDGLEQYYNGKISCDDAGFYKTKCLAKVNSLYQEKMKAEFGQRVDPNYWCVPVKGKEAYKSVGGRFVKQQQADGYDCDVSRSFVRSKMLKLKGLDSVSFDSWGSFISSPMVGDKIRKKLSVKGIQVPSGFRLGSHDGFIRGLSKELKRLLKEEFVKKSKVSFGEPISPMLKRNQFLALPLIQQPLKKALKLDASDADVSLNMSEVQFRDKILMPGITKELEVERVRLLASAAQFADGAEKAEEGRQYVRSILIPPIAMGLSLFFALLNFSAVVAGGLRLFKVPHMVASSLKFGFIAAVIVLPLVFSGNVAKTPVFQSIVDETSKEIGVLGGGFIMWLSSLQPVIYPVGINIAEALDFFPPEQESQIKQ